MLAVLFLTLIHSSLSQYETSWSISLSRPPTSLKIASSGRSNHQHIMAGYPNGQLEVIDSHSKQVVKSLHLLDEGVMQMEVDSENGISFVVGSINMVQLDHQYNIRNVFAFEKNITHLSLSKLDERTSLVNFQIGNKIVSLQYSSLIEDKLGIKNSWNSNLQHHIAGMSLNHKYLFTVGQDKSSFKVQKVHPSFHIKTNSIQFIKEDFIQRKFSFKIDRLVLDYKENNKNDQQLLMITEDGTIFYVRAGNIVTYIPYSISSNQHLTTVDFCQNGFITIIHERKINNYYSEYYLTLVRKDNLASHKVILLNEVFGQVDGIQSMDCNHNLIVLQNKEKLYVLQSFKVFSIQQYPTQFLFILGFMAILLYYFSREPVKNTKTDNFEPNSQAHKQKDSSSEEKLSQQKQKIKTPNKEKGKKRKGD